MGNLPPGADGVSTTVALTLESFIAAIKSEMTDVKIVYDEKFSYETALEIFRANNSSTGTLTDAYPLFAFRRSVLRYVEPAGPGRRATSMMAKRDMTGQNYPGESNIYKMVHGEIDVNFMYITKSVFDLEKFEILYLSEEGISSYKELEVNLESELGLSLPYFCSYEPLEDKFFESENMYYKMIQGTVKIRGFYPVFRTRTKHIEEITLRVNDFLGAVYYNTQITS